ncbi:MAG: YihY/virulence factor BrkB family protein [Burkholderiaceae bacterium]
MKIPGLRGMRPFALIKEAIKSFNEDDMSTYASGLAYQILFSFFPFFIFLIALISTLHLPDFMMWLRQQAEMFLPEQAMDQVNMVLNQLQQPRGGLLSAGAIVALWTASAGARATMNALNVAYGVKEGRPAWKIYLLSIFYTLAIAAMLTGSAALLLVGPQAMEWLSYQIGFEKFFVTLWAWVRWPIGLFLLTLSVAIVYYSAPDAQQKFRFITPGAVLSVLVWILASLAFDFYVSNFGNYNAMYGSIGAVIVLLLYFYISSAVLLFGAEINAVIEHYAPSGKNYGEKTLPENK